MFNYHLSVGQSLKYINIKHEVKYFSKTLDVNLNSWDNCLKTGELDYSISKYLNRKKILRFPIDIYLFTRSLNKSIKNEKDSFIFIERFNFIELLIISLICINKLNSLIILFRHDLVHYGYKIIIYKFILKILIYFKGKKLIIVTDSVKLSITLGNYFKIKIETLPVPISICKNKIENKKDLIKLGWPGPPRIEKGWDKILILIKDICKSNINIILYVSEDASNLINDKIVLLNSTMSNLEYLNNIHSLDIVLLPYDYKKYKYSTYNIFI